MRITFINKSDSLGGAAVVTLRLVEALRGLGVDARLLVTHKTTDLPYVAQAASPRAIRRAFLADRLPLLLHNGFRRDTLFQIDAARAGLPLWRHPWVTQADAVALGWINQGVLSIDGVRRIGQLGKPLLWIMHDMWCMTGVCHHAHACRHYMHRCGNCPLLGSGSSAHDLSCKVWQRKKKLYGEIPIRFIAVSNWLRSRCEASSLLSAADVSVIGNAFPSTPLRGLPTIQIEPTGHIIMVAARLDDPVKGLPLLVETTRQLQLKDAALAKRLHFDLVGELRDPSLLKDMAIPYTLHGHIADSRQLKRLYENASAVISPSLFETLPGTLIEGMDLGRLPVAFDRGGQSDIVDHLSTGYLATWDDDPVKASSSLADGIIWAIPRSTYPGIVALLNNTIRSRFSADAIAHRYLTLLKTI